MFDVSYSVLNGSPFGNFVPSRGVKQGDPLSPYLFIIGAKVLSRMLILAENIGAFQGVGVAKDAPSISHLFFVYDIFIFCGVNSSVVREIKDILDEYCEASGKLVNFNQCAIYLRELAEIGGC